MQFAEKMEQAWQSCNIEMKGAFLFICVGKGRAIHLFAAFIDLASGKIYAAHEILGKEDREHQRCSNRDLI